MPRCIGSRGQASIPIAQGWQSMEIEGNLFGSAVKEPRGIFRDSRGVTSPPWLAASFSSASIPNLSREYLPAMWRFHIRLRLRSWPACLMRPSTHPRAFRWGSRTHHRANRYSDGCFHLPPDISGGEPTSLESRTGSALPGLDTHPGGPAGSRPRRASAPHLHTQIRPRRQSSSPSPYLRCVAG